MTGLIKRGRQTPPMTKHLDKAIAFYLPQFHPIPENDEWWGKGFTEWTNVAQCKPLFRGHYQPHIPSDLGFYDLRLPEARIAQAELARQHGIEAFCYWHYWFNGKRLLERPFNDVIESGKPDFPFCLAWANESWSRRWLGEEKALLMQQTYSPEDGARHALWLAEKFTDRRYVRVNRRPLFLVYRPKHLPDPIQFTEVLRETCLRHGGEEPYLVGIDAHCPGYDCRQAGFDMTLRFEPQLGCLRFSGRDHFYLPKVINNLLRGKINLDLKLYDYSKARRLMNKIKLDHPYIPCVFVSWDNTPRRGRNGVIITGSTPEKFSTGVKEALGLASKLPNGERLLFVNAWNEWAEGNHLEPDHRFGKGFLQELSKALSSPI